MIDSLRKNRIAFVHCWLLPGGARRVLLDIMASSSFDEAHVFTLLSNERTVEINGMAIKVVTALPKRLCQVFFFFQQTIIMEDKKIPRRYTYYLVFCCSEKHRSG